jgi:hypothetical protein
LRDDRLSPRRQAAALAALNRGLLGEFSRRTVEALRGALPLRLAPAGLERVVALNVAKEVRKDALVIRRASEAPAAGPQADRRALLALLQATKEIDRAFLEHVARFPIGIVIRYEQIEPVRLRRIERLFAAAQRVLAAWPPGRGAREALRAAFPRDELEQLLLGLLQLYGEETLVLSRSVRLPALLAPVRELAAQRLVRVMDGVAERLAKQAVLMVYR